MFDMSDMKDKRRDETGNVSIGGDILQSAPVLTCCSVNVLLLSWLVLLLLCCCLPRRRI